MKLLSSYLKEMKIASRGFYFYIEIFIAIIMLLVILVVINPNPDGKMEEYLYNDMPSEAFEYSVNKDITKGKAKWIEDRSFELKPVSFQLENKDTGEVTAYDFTDHKTVVAKTLQRIDSETGKVRGVAYIFENEEDILRLSVTTGKIAATTTLTDQGELSFRYFLQGYETERYSNILYVLHTNTTDEIQSMSDQQVVRSIGKTTEYMNNQEAIVPIFVAFAGALMGFFIIMSYIYLDKDEGVIKAFAVTPSSVWKYLLSKTFVIMTTVVISSSIIVIPIMRLKPNYLLFYPFLMVSTFAFASLGLLVASFFDSISKAFGVLYFVLIALMLPAFSYYISSFDPIWLRYFPTYPLLESLKGILMGQPDVAYVLSYTLIFFVAGILLLIIANIRFKKSLTV